MEEVTASCHLLVVEFDEELEVDLGLGKLSIVPLSAVSGIQRLPCAPGRAHDEPN